ncbi:hypothetical protein V6N13_106041 [Hibiscus sabdariffa]|uniref:Uncharacterized protein n=1 Tax=Hibiscus sabdariffa TaxID=183260 RepID=A0ABR2EZH2_9ROSI
MTYRIGPWGHVLYIVEARPVGLTTNNGAWNQSRVRVPGSCSSCSREATFLARICMYLGHGKASFFADRAFKVKPGVNNVFSGQEFG